MNYTKRFDMLDLTFMDAVTEWAIEHPEVIPIFEKHGIDYCCPGKSLANACQQRGADLHLVLLEINEAIAPT
jgi:iron-sulfur cluster repair protein YtfE (RIC family)